MGTPFAAVTYFDRDLSWDLEVEEFVRCILDDKPVAMSSSADALRVIGMIERAYEDANKTKDLAKALDKAKF